MGKEKEHRRHAHHPTAIGEQDKEPQGQASSIKETWHPLAESRPEDPTQSEKRVIARQDSHVSRSEKHKDIQDLERRMAQVKHLWHACILWMLGTHAPCPTSCRGQEEHASSTRLGV